MPGPSQVLGGLQLPLGCLKRMLTAATCLGHLRWPCKQYWVNGKSGARSKPFGKQQGALKLSNWLQLGGFLQLKGAKYSVNNSDDSDQLIQIAQRLH